MCDGDDDGLAQPYTNDIGPCSSLNDARLHIGNT